MRVRQRLPVVIVLIIATVFMGVYQNEKQTEPKGAVQAGAYTGNDRGSWLTRSGTTGSRKDTSQYESRPTDGPATTSDYRGSTATVATGSPKVSGQSETMEAGKPSASLGAGYITDITVRQGYRYYTADELAKGLLHDLVPLAPCFIEAQETYGIDAVFLAAIAAEESGWGRYQFRQNNIFGFENCDFESVEHCIDYAASWLKTQYLTPDGTYYEGVGVADVNKHYNGRDTWEEHITAIMSQIVARIESEG